MKSMPIFIKNRKIFYEVCVMMIEAAGYLLITMERLRKGEENYGKYSSDKSNRKDEAGESDA